MTRERLGTPGLKFVASAAPMSSSVVFTSTEAYFSCEANKQTILTSQCIELRGKGCFTSEGLSSSGPVARVCVTESVAPMNGGYCFVTNKRCVH